MFKNVFRKCRQNRGFTLMEVMVVVAILAVVVLIAVPSVIKMRQNMKFAERNDYAKSIYMAAQSNLTQMRSMGELGTITPPDEAYKASPPTVPFAKAQISNENSPNPPSSYLHAGNKAEIAYNYWSDILPANAIDSTVRDGQHSQIIIEYNPQAGIVYSVFYYDDDDFDLTSEYNNGTLTRISEDIEQHSPSYGYYTIKNVDALEDTALKVFNVSSSISYDNGQEGLLTVYIPTQSTENGITNIYDGEIGSLDKYVQQLKIELTVTGENSGTFKTVVKETNVIVPYTVKDLPGESGGSNFVHIEIPLDSLKSASNSFSSNPSNTVTSEAGITSSAIPAGDNISVTADITFYPDADDPIVMIESATIAGINPMYHSLTPNPNYDPEDDDSHPYILAVSNGRHLQNLSYLDAEFAQNIESIVFTQQAEDPVQPENGSTEGSTSESQPADTPSPAAETETNGSGTLTLDWKETAEAYKGTGGTLPFSPIDFSDLADVPSILGNDVTIKNMTINSDETDVGLFAKLDGVTIKNITLDGTNTITAFGTSGVQNVGALAGSATGAAIENCDTSAKVSGANGVQSNVGGLVGSSDGTDYTNCGSSATVRGGAYVDTTNYSYLGGLVGLAKNANFNSASSSASVKGTNALNDSGNYIPQSNYIGGLIGRAESCDFVSNVNANLTDLPAYAYGAGGLAGWIIGGEINANIGVALDCESSLSEVERFGGLAVYIENVDIETTGEAPIKIDIDGALSGNMVAGALIGSMKSTVENIEVSIDGSISGKDVAGFASTANQTIDKCRVILETKDAFIYGSNSAAGFINLNEANITNSYVYAKELQDDTGISVGKVDASNDGMASGFALTNEASIKQCMANVKVTKDSLFVRTNKDTVKNCYGWLWGNDSTSALRISNNCSYSYFVNGNTKQLAFYEGLGSNAASVLSSNILDTDALTDSWAVTLLNNGTGEEEADVWESGSNSYPYPKLTGFDHKGASAAPAEGQYPFGLIYEETYKDGDKGYIVTALEGNSLTTSSPSGLSNDKEIDSTAFYLYHRTDDSLKSEGSALGSNPFDWLNVNRLYTIYKLNADNHTVDQKTFNSFYPVDGNTYRIRTSEQFGYISKNPSSTFRIEKSMEVSGTISSFGGSMTASSGVIITSKQSLVNNLSGTLSGLTVTGLTEPMVGTVTGGTIDKCTLTEVKITSGENVGAFAGTLEGGTISGGNAEGSVSGSNYVGGAIGYVKSGTVTGVTNVNVAVSATGENTKAGMFVGYAEGGSFTNCHSTAKSTGLPFGHFPTAEIQNVTHSTQNQPQGKLYIDFFEQNFSEVSTAPKTVEASLDNCTLKDGDGTNKNAVRNSSLHYYNVKADKQLAEKGTQYTAELRKVEEAVTYASLLTLAADSTNPVNTGYYVRMQTNNSYGRLYVTVTSADEPISTDNSSETHLVYTFTFTATGLSNAAYSKEIKIAKSNLDTRITNDITLHEIFISDKSPCAITGQYYLLHSDSGYLSYDAASGTTWITGELPDIDTCLWIGFPDGGWKNFTDASTVITTKMIDVSGDEAFTGPVSITFESRSDKLTMSYTHFCAQYVALYYECEYLGTATEIFYPTPTT